jgi:hypothetical protein
LEINPEFADGFPGAWNNRRPSPDQRFIDVIDERSTVQ